MGSLISESECPPIGLDSSICEVQMVRFEVAALGFCQSWLFCKESVAAQL